MSSSQDQLPYTQAQVEAYLSRVSLPEIARSKGSLEYLSALQKHHLVAVPFENLSLHYSKEHTNSLNKDDLYEKIVTRRKGGYCFESNGFFGLMLRSLGFEVVSVGARVTLVNPVAGWDHHVNLVSIAGMIYLVDVAFGGSCPTRPMPLVHDHVSRWGITAAKTRLTFQSPSNRIVQGLWALEHQKSPSDEWTPCYTFALTEFNSKDFEVMNYAVSTRKTSFWTYSIICMKMIRDEEANDITGIVALEGGRLKRRIHAESETLAECANEEERVDVLDKYFGIRLNSTERKGIMGTVTQLKGDFSAS
ncbi:cysteine proteinase [Acephala macrosclerotiorum]|nr:cysteine proteinase [Acephala macrosclerotiorum]